jgi:hypothetical protein
MATIPLFGNNTQDLHQSGYLHIQAAGSTGADGSTNGIHLRWDLLGSLGSKHLPKGNLAAQGGDYPTSIEYNKADDFVTIYRTRFKSQFYTQVNLTSAPTVLTETGPERKWEYQGIQPIASAPTITTNVAVRFLDITQYDTIRATINPATNAEDFIKAYTGIVEIEALNKYSFLGEITVKFQDPGNINTAFVKAEAISVPDTLETASKTISCRKSFTGSVLNNPATVKEENIQYLRLQYSNAYLTVVRLYTYYDYALGTNLADDWAEIGDFSLTDDDATAYNRLDNALTVINNRWPRYNDTDATGAFKVNTSNYQDKWLPSSNSAEGLKEAVINYLTLSMNDVYAVDYLPSQLPNDSASFELSYLKMLRLVALDFHVSRMLGLGHIDARIERDSYIYAASYLTEKKLEPSQNDIERRHIFLTLPTTQTEYRLPPAPQLSSLSYGLTVDNGTSTPTLLTDSNGYAQFDDSRFINLIKAPFAYDVPLEPFFANTVEFCLSDMTKPVAYGVEYKESSEQAWRSPELSNDPDYTDPAGIEEVVPIPEQANPIFIHKETEEGVHVYGLYAINIFSRPSPVGNTLATDYTDFPVRNTLIPPTNLAVQLIQQEGTLIFTTPAEQTRLASITGLDKTLVRVTFDWNHVHSMAYQFGTRAQLFFRENSPATTRGEINQIINLTDNKVQVHTTSYLVQSTNPIQTVQPVINNPSAFIGGLFCVGDAQYTIDSVQQSGNDPVFILHRIKQTQSQEYPLNSNNFITTETYVAPVTGDRFLVVENLGDSANWDSQLVKEIDLVNFTPTHTETITHPDGSQETLTIGGIYEPATIRQVFDTVSPFGPTGVYEIEFNTYQLAAHPDPDVEWYKGTVRVPIPSTSEKKVLQVWKIDSATNGSLLLTVFDPDITADPIVPGSTPQLTNVFVNFHPSYRAYFYEDSINGNNFNDVTILPGQGGGNKKTYMAVRAVDTTLTPDLNSYISTPVVLLAQEIVAPEAPYPPIGATFATRPDFYAKSTYTFDTKMKTASGRKPFALVFYRANERSVLDALYTKDTADAVQAALKNMDPEEPDVIFMNSRWFDLVNGVYDSLLGLFREHTVGGFRFPLPDNPNFFLISPTSPPTGPSVKIFPFSGYTDLNSPVSTFPSSFKVIDAVKVAVNKAFLPLTEQPLVYEYIKGGLQTSGRKPVIRDSNGDLIQPGSSGYEPSPMATQYAKDTLGAILFPGDPNYNNQSNEFFVRFTDYTLDGAAQSIYFYYAVEMSNRMEVSDRSDVLGPILLVNSYPAEAPQIRKVIPRLEGEGYPTTVKLEIIPFTPGEKIKQVQVYRALNQPDALSVRSMQLVTTVGSDHELIDEFADLGYVPYGSPLFYRVVGLREILNEQSQVEMVPTMPSKVAMANIVDVNNPEAPQLTYISDPVQATTTVTLTNVVLSWPKTAHNATYYLYKMDSKIGNWERIYEISTNAALMSYTLPSALVKYDSNGNTLYHRFRVGVKNSSGLLNLTYKELTI